MGDTADYYKELVESVNNNSNNSGFGGFFSFLGNQIYNVAENLGINKVYNDTKNTIDNNDYAKSAGGYLVDKGKELANTNIVQGAVNKVKEGVDFVNNSAINMINNINNIGNENKNASESKENEVQPNNLDFLNDNNNNIYQQLSQDQM